ncbi:MAG: hypothetical protein JWQ27_1776 [Ferruginibacter sp.]|nr:hypothetical protein [Ferruginibacter sp.]
MKRLLLLLSLMPFFFSAPAQQLQLVKELNTNPGGHSYPYGFTVVGSKLFFIATNASFQVRLYVSQGTDATTELLGPSTATNGSISNLISYNGKLFFSCNDGVNGQELWTSDGTVGGTVLFKDLYPGSNGSYPEAFTITNNKLFFMGAAPTGERRLYASDGTTGGTSIIRDNYIQVFNGMTNFPVMNNEIYFIGDNGTGSGSGLWRSNGTLGGTVVVRGDIFPGNTGGNYAVLNNKLYFSCFDYINGSELWVTDGSNAGTHIVKNLSPDAGGVFGNGAPQGLTVFNSKIYFSATDGTHGNELFVSDGTDPGTVLVKDIFPGTDGSIPYNITVYNGMMYLTCWGLQQLWKSDGTGAGTQLVKDLPQYSRFGEIWNNKMYLISNSFTDLWQSDGTPAGTGVATATNTINPINITGSDQHMTIYNNGLYFSGYCFNISSGYEPLRFITGLPPLTTYTFNGSGNWSNPANWSGGIVPPSTLLSTDRVIISGICTLDITQHAQSGSVITVSTGGTLIINGSLTIS